jgi:hypothetical protein
MPDPKPKPRRINVPKLVLVAVIASAIAVCIAAGPRNPHQEQATTADCDPGLAARRAWFTATPSDGRSPKDEGFLILGDCATTVLHREFTCEEASVRRINSDNPYLKEAIALGFATYVCEAPNDSHVEYSMQRLFAP